MKSIGITLLLFLHFHAAAQLAIIQGEDGETQVRKTANINSPAVFRIAAGEVFLIDEAAMGADPNWVAVSQANQPTVTQCYSPENRSGFIHKSRVLPISSIKAQLSTELTDGLVTLTNNSIQVVLRVESVTQAPANTCLLGSDQGYGQVSNRLASMSVKINNRMVTLPANVTKYLYEVDEKSIKAYLHENLVLIQSGTFSAAGNYECVWVIKDGKFSQRFIYQWH